MSAAASAAASASDNDAESRYAEAAEAIGLRYVGDDEPGIRRERVGDGFQYRDARRTDR